MMKQQKSSVDLLRKRISEKKYLDYLKTLQQLDNSLAAEDDVQFKELNKKVHSLLNQLTPRQKEIFLLSREEGLSHDEIAK